METQKIKKPFFNFQTWKNHGIWKKPQKPGKIMEFEKIDLEKSWNFFSDLKFFARFARISSIMYMALYILLLYIDFSKIYFYHTSCD